MNNKRGFAQWTLLLGLLFMGLALAFVSKLAMQNQDNRNKAASSFSVIGTPTPRVGMCDDSCVTHTSSCVSLGMGDGLGKCSNGGICCKRTSQVVTPTQVPTGFEMKECGTLTCLAGQTKMTEKNGRCWCVYLRPSVSSAPVSGLCSSLTCPGGGYIKTYVGGGACKCSLPIISPVPTSTLNTCKGVCVTYGSGCAAVGKSNASGKCVNGGSCCSR